MDAVNEFEPTQRGAGPRAPPAIDQFRWFKSWLDQNVFREAAPSPPIPTWRVLLYGAVVIAAAAIELARMWTSKPLNTIWAEDGATWLADAVHRRFFDALTTPYDGYLQTSSRLLGKLVAALPIGSYAEGMAIAGALMVAGCALLVWRASAAHISDPVLRGSLAALMILLPIADVELLGNVTNSIWFLLFVAFWMLLWRPASLKGAMLAGVVLFLAAVSNVGVVALGPVWLLRLLVVRDSRDGIIVTAFAVGVVAQFALSWNDLNTSGEAGTLQGSLTPHWDWGLIPAYLQRIVGAGVLGNTLAGAIWKLLGTLLEVLLGAALVVLVLLAVRRRNPHAQLLVPLAVTISVGLFLVTGYQRWQSGGSNFLWPRGTFNNAFSRFMVVPALLVLSALFIGLDGRHGSSGIRTSVTWQRVIAVGLLVAALFSFNAADSALRGRPTWSEALAMARKVCRETDAASVRVTVAPTVIPGAFALPLSCRSVAATAKRTDAPIAAFAATTPRAP